MARYYSEVHGGEGVTDKEKRIVEQPYYSSQNTFPPRYYQRNAVNRTVEAIARGKDRLLLVMATGERVIIVIPHGSAVNTRTSAA